MKLRQFYGNAVILSSLLLSPAAAERDKAINLDLGNGQRIECVWIPPGDFLKGSPASDILAGDSEKPQKRVNIETGFYLGRTTVTFGQFQEFIADTGYRTDAEREQRPRFRGGHGFNSDRNRFEGWFPQYTWRNPGWPITNLHPAGNLSWNDSKAFCDWLSSRSGRTVRLPSENEWEYACRAGSTNIFFTSDSPGSLEGFANIPDEALSLKLGEPVGVTRFKFNDGFAFTAPVGSFKPNSWGLYDMLGNVFQWCSDEISDPEPNRVLRGGSYNMNIETCRIAFRGFSKPEGRYSYTGFRIVTTEPRRIWGE